MKIEELEELNAKLEVEKRNEKAKYDEVLKKKTSFKDELNNAYEKITTLQNQVFEYEKNMQESNQIKAEITILKTQIKENDDKHAKELQNEKKNIEKAKQAISKKLNEEIEKLRNINEQQSKDYDSLKSNIDELNNKIADKTKEIEKLQKDLKEEKEKQKANLSISTHPVPQIKPASSLNTLTAEQSNLTQLITSASTNRPVNTPVSLSVLLKKNPNESNYGVSADNNSSLSSLESPKNDGQSANREIELKKQVQNLMELLNESERNVRELTKKENNLKEEIDKMNRDEKRTTVNMEYLKNVVLSFLESNDKGKLVPVITNLLQLDSKEIERLQALSEKRKRLW